MTGTRSSRDDLLARPRTPVDADAHLVALALRLRGEGDVGDERPQQPLAILVGGARGMPKTREIGRKRLELRTRREWGDRGAGGECGLGFGHRLELRLPAILQAAGDQAVLGLAGPQGTLGPNRFVAGAFELALESTARALPPLGDLLGRGESERDVLGGDGSLFSRSSSAMRCCSAVVTPGRRPPSTSAWSTQVRSDSGPIPS